SRRDARGDTADRGRSDRACRRRRRRGEPVGMDGVVPLAEAHDHAVFGSKAVGLGDAIRGGVPVPPGYALSGPTVDAVASGEESAITQVADSVRSLPPPFAVRSSAVGEDGAGASFAGQHITLLNV